MTYTVVFPFSVEGSAIPELNENYLHTGKFHTVNALKFYSTTGKNTVLKNKFKKNWYKSWRKTSSVFLIQWGIMAIQGVQTLPSLSASPAEVTLGTSRAQSRSVVHSDLQAAEHLWLFYPTLLVPAAHYPASSNSALTNQQQLHINNRCDLPFSQQFSQTSTSSSGRRTLKTSWSTVVTVFSIHSEPGRTAISAVTSRGRHIQAWSLNTFRERERAPSSFQLLVYLLMRQDSVLSQWQRCYI